jgi:hypothetical protein
VSGEAAAWLGRQHRLMLRWAATAWPAMQRWPSLFPCSSGVMQESDVDVDACSMRRLPSSRQTPLQYLRSSSRVAPSEDGHCLLSNCSNAYRCCSCCCCAALRLLGHVWRPSGCLLAARLASRACGCRTHMGQACCCQGAHSAVPCGQCV